MPRVSIKKAQQEAAREEKRALAARPSWSTTDSLVNFAHKMGVGADNPLSSTTYGFNPITRNRVMMEWMYRGAWLPRLAVDIPAEDMTRKGIEYTSEMPPEDTGRLDMMLTGKGIWPAISEVIKWARLYGGAIGVALIEGQDPRTPLRPDTIQPGGFKGVLALDRWMLQPTTDDLVTEYGPHLGLPRYYRVQENAPALRGESIHYTRVMFRLLGASLPYHQALSENLWGASIFESLYDRLLGFDSATTGAIQLVFKSYLRTLKIKGMREIVAAQGKPLEALVQYADMMRRWQSIEGMSLIDSEDELSVDGHQAFSGLADILVHLGQHVSGALQIPLVRLFGQSPSGLNSTGESDIRTYYDGLAQQQAKDLHRGVTLIHILEAKSLGLKLPEDFGVKFRTLWDMSEPEKATTASSVAEAVTKAHESGLISDRTAMQELRQSSRSTGIFSNITTEQIEAASDQITPPPDALGGLPPDPLDPLGVTSTLQGLTNGQTGQIGQAQPIQPSPRGRVRVQQPAPTGGPAGAQPPAGNDPRG